MEDVLNLIVTNLVQNKEAVSISKSEENDKSVVYTVKVATEDMGKVIGKEGKVANAIRILLKSIVTADKKKVSVKFID